MNNSGIRFLLGGVILILVIAACVIPGQAVPSAPSIDPHAVETSIAGTVQAAQTQTSVPQVVATESPASMKGAVVEQMQDGTTKYTDFDGGFEITFPVGWLAVRPNSDEFDAALAGAGAANEMLHDQMTTDMAGYEADVDRLYAYILRPDIEKNIIFGFSKLVWDLNDTVSIDDYTMGRLVNELETSGGIPGFRASVVQLHEDSAVKMIEIGGRWTWSDGQGGTIPSYSAVYFFKPSPTSLARITFTFFEQYHAQIAPDVNSIVGSIRLVEP